MAKPKQGNIQGERRNWTTSSLAYLERAKQVMADLSDYWPLTLRQIYYQLVGALVIENNIGEYKKLSDTLADARIDGLIEWEAMEDRSRTLLDSTGWTDKTIFTEAHLENFLSGYNRDLLQSQDCAIEAWVEKDALAHIIHGVAAPYCVSVIVAKGFSSVTFKDQCRNRIVANARAGRRTLILYFGDLDPSGWSMLPAMMKTLQEHMRLKDVVSAERCALLPEQVFEYSLPRSIDAMKEKDSRTPKYRAMLREAGYPDDLAVELDALPPRTLENLVRDSIERNLDLVRFRAGKGNRRH